MTEEIRRRQPRKSGGNRPGAGHTEGGNGSPPGIRLQRVLADAGVASRRDCEALIEAGRVSVNGEMTRVLPVFVDPENDRIEVDGRLVGKPERRLYLLLNKPERVLTTVDDHSEFAGTGTARMTVLDLVDHPAKARLFPVGRLDFATRGLVLLTNDGELANRLTHPRYGVPKVYEAVVKGRVNDEQLAELRKLVGKQERQDLRKREPATPGGGGPQVRSKAEIELIDSGPGETTIRLVLRERTGYPLRKIIVSAGCPVKKLTRVALGPLELIGVREGQWRELTRAELMLLRRDPRRAPAKLEENGTAATRRSSGVRGGHGGGATRGKFAGGPGGGTSAGGVRTGNNGPGSRGKFGPGPGGGSRGDQRGGGKRSKLSGGPKRGPGEAKGPSGPPRKRFAGPGFTRSGRPRGEGGDA